MTGLNRRKTKSIPIIAYEKEDLPELIEKLVSIIEKTEWGYTSEFKDVLVMRDKALVAFLFLTGLRVSEVVGYTKERPDSGLKLSQIRERPKKFMVYNVLTVKRGDDREIEIPIDGSLGQLTVYFDNWYRYLTKTGKGYYLFPSASGFGINYRKPIPKARVHQIMKTTTNYFPHWCRAVYENIYGHIIFDNNPYKLKECMGLKRMDSTEPYIQSDWKKDLDKLYFL